MSWWFKFEEKHVSLPSSWVAKQEAAAMTLAGATTLPGEERKEAGRLRKCYSLWLYKSPGLVKRQNMFEKNC